jgi:hypothetical protein
MILKLTQDLSRGFVPWKEMYFENIARLEAIGGKLILRVLRPMMTIK